MVTATGGRRITIVDTTLRDGEQTPGLRFTARQRLELAHRLDGIGVDEIEVGTPGAGPGVQASIRQVVAAGLRCRVTGWCRAVQADVDAAAACGLRSVHLSVPTSDVQLAAFEKSCDWIERTLRTLLPTCVRRFDYVSVGAMDASRAPSNRLRWLAALVAALGAHRLRVADTVGVWGVGAASHVVAELRDSAPGLTIGVHMHNDLGMAVANSLAAAEAGADAVDVTVTGLGERAGNAALEQVVMAMRLTTSLQTGIDAAELAPLCDLVASWRGVSHAENQPLVGSNIFRHESGIHVHGVLRDPASFEPFAPEMVGRAGREIVLGVHSGRGAVAWALQQEGLAVDAAVLTTTVEAVRAEAYHTGKPVSSSRAAELASYSHIWHERSRKEKQTCSA